jgi:hypothetical protein
MNLLKSLTGIAIATMLASGPLLAQPHAGDMIIGATGDGTGALAIEYDFSGKVKTAFAAEIAGTSIYTATEPGFDALDMDEPLESFFVLDDTTEVTVEITRIDAGKTALQLNAATLDAVGESVVLGTQGAAPPGDLHHHPEFQLLLMLPAGEFGEGSISFKLTTTSVAYTESEEYTVTLTNGHLAGVAYDDTSVDNQSVNCQKTVAKEIRKLNAASYKLLSKCLDKVQSWEAKEAAAHPGATAALATAEAQCADASGSGPDDKTMLGRIGAAKQKAVDAIVDKCGTAGSGDYLETNDIKAHVNMAQCRTEELISAGYGFAQAQLAHFTLRASQGGGPLDTAFPCLVPAP